MSLLTQAATEPRAPSRVASSRGIAALIAHQARFELLVARRNPRARFVTLFFPVLLLVIFAGVLHGTTIVDGRHIKLARYFTAGILAMAIVLASSDNLVVAIAALRESGVLKRRRATPVPVALIVGLYPAPEALHHRVRLRCRLRLIRRLGSELSV